MEKRVLAEFLGPDSLQMVDPSTVALATVLPLPPKTHASLSPPAGWLHVRG